MQRTIFIIHGFMGHPNENWIPWLKTELEKLDCQVIVPQFPTPENQTLEAWLEVLEPYKTEIREDTLFIGHSLGVSFVLNVLERQEWPIQAAFLVAGFVGLLNITSIDPMAATFTQKHFDWQHIQKMAKHFYIFSSDNDPYVPVEKAQYLARELQRDVIMVPGAGHFNLKAGYDDFGLLLDRVKDELSR